MLRPLRSEKILKKNSVPGNPFAKDHIKGSTKPKLSPMNKILSKLTLLAILIGPLLLTGCQDRTLRTYEANTPVYKSLDEWRQTEFSMTAPQVLKYPGKIYIYEQYLLVNELYNGVHFFDNSNPANPVNLGFLSVTANVDMAVRNDILYLDSYYDLLAFDISNVAQPRYLGRSENVFEFEDYGYVGNYNENYPMGPLDPSLGVVVDWEITEVTEVIQTSGNWGWRDGFTTDVAFVNNSGNESANLFNSVGTAGSTARFAIYENILYTLEAWELGVFDIDQGIPQHINDVELSRDSETLWPAQDHLFIGTTSGMLIYDLASPRSPVLRSDYGHVVACDPVVVSGDRAYVTLSTGRFCGGNTNALEVIDISNLSSPRLIRSHALTNPRGLGVANDVLFICDGPDGLKAFDRTDDLTITQNLIAHFPGITTNDVIPLNNVLLMTAEEGIYQYDYTDVNNITELSLIPIQ